ncbi:unnamed protein product, partial [Timema podura]|nr:unnamed protein product [Timema podura]
GDVLQESFSAFLVVRFNPPNSSTVLSRIKLNGSSAQHCLSLLGEEPIVVSRFDSSTLYPLSKCVSLKNKGVIDLKLSVSLAGIKEGVMAVDPTLLHIPSGEAVSLTILLWPTLTKRNVNGSLKAQVQPDGRVYQWPIKGNVTDSVISPRHSAPSRSSNSSGSKDNSLEIQSIGSSLSNSLPICKLQIHATHPVLSWGSLKLGHSEMKSTSLRNYAPHSYKLRLTVMDSDNIFKVL